MIIIFPVQMDNSFIISSENFNYMYELFNLHTRARARFVKWFSA